MKKTLIEKYRTNSLSKAELEEFLKWARTADSAEIEKLLQEDMDSFQSIPETAGDLKAQEVVGRRLRDVLFARQKSKSVYKIACVAAAVIIPILIFGNVYLYNKSQSESTVPVSVMTDAKHLTTVELPDGSNVEINSESRLSYGAGNFQKDVRSIEFEGEGYFKIVKNKDCPFKVNSKELEVMVYGTEFNLQAYDDASAATLSLIDGSVKMTSKKTGENVTLEPNEVATLDYATGAIEVRAMAPNDNSLAWKTGRLRFTNAPVSEVIRQIETNYSCKVVADNKVYSEIYTGVIPLDDLHSALSILEEIYSTPFSYKK